MHRGVQAQMKSRTLYPKIKTETRLWKSTLIYVLYSTLNIEILYASELHVGPLTPHRTCFGQYMQGLIRCAGMTRRLGRYMYLVCATKNVHFESSTALCV